MRSADIEMKTEFRATVNWLGVFVCQKRISMPILKEERQGASRFLTGVISFTSMIKNKTISWKEQPQATLEAIIVPILNQLDSLHVEGSGSNHS